MDESLTLQVVGAFFGLWGQHLVNNRMIAGFYAWLVSNAALIGFQLLHSFYVLAGLHGIYLVMALRGIYLWRRAPGPNPIVAGK